MTSANARSRYSVAIIVASEFGPELATLAQRLHVWVRSTRENGPYLQRAFETRPEKQSLERGVTSFSARESCSPDEALLGVLGTVDLHHGEYSHSPPWEVLEVYGASATPAVREALAVFGVDTFTITPRGFLCSRPGHKES